MNFLKKKEEAVKVTWDDNMGYSCKLISPDCVEIFPFPLKQMDSPQSIVPGTKLTGLKSELYL